MNVETYIQMYLCSVYLFRFSVYPAHLRTCDADLTTDGLWDKLYCPNVLCYFLFIIYRERCQKYSHTAFELNTQI